MIVCLLVLLWSAVPAVACPGSAPLALQVLGSGGPELDDRRASSGYLVWLEGKATVLVDAGSGVALNFEKSGASYADLKAVLFTHFHVDHSVDFPSLVKGGYFGDRVGNLPVYGPAGNARMPAASDFLSLLIGEDGAFRYLSSYLAEGVPEDYKLEITDVPLAPQKIHRYPQDARLGLSAVPVHHGPLPAVAWRVDAGDYSVTFSGDMSNRYGTLADLAAGSDLLVAHNAVPEGATGAARSLHMPPSQIGRIAAAAKVGGVVLSHRMQRTLARGEQTKNRIREHYTGMLAFAEDLDCFAVRSGVVERAPD